MTEVRTRARAAVAARDMAEDADARPRVAAREATADFDRNGNPIFRDRDGNVLSRKNKGPRNEFDFSPAEVPEGYEYQWIRHTVYGDPSDSELFEMQENGWRPVPHERHATRFALTELHGKGCILRKGQLLVERPLTLSDEARRDDKRSADGAIGDQFRRFSVPLPDNVRNMGLASRGSVARKSDDVFSVRDDVIPKHVRADLSIE